jgi:hypothetical protein
MESSLSLAAKVVPVLPAENQGVPFSMVMRPML